MSKKKQDKASHGRHAADASQTQENDQQAAFVAPATAEIPPTAAALSVDAPARRHRPLKVLGIIFGVIIALLLAAYVGLSVYFMGHFMPNSNIGNLDVSLMDSAEASSMLANSVDDYKLSVSGEGFTLKLTASDAGLSLDAAAVIKDALSAANPWTWPLTLRVHHDATDKLVASYNGTGLEDAIRKAVDSFNATAIQPINATIAYDDTLGAFAVKPEVAGTALNVDAVIATADKAIVSLAEKVKLTDEELIQPTVLATDPRLTQAAEAANTMITADIVLTMAETEVVKVDASLISQWVRLDENLVASLDENALTAWVGELAAQCNTIGAERTYTRPDGKVITVAGGSYGWEVDQEALLTVVRDGVAAGQKDTAAIPCLVEGSGYGSLGGRDWGNRYVDVDLSEQHARFYDDSGALIWETDVITGVPSGGEKDTPAGVWYVTTMASPSILYTYEKGKEKPNKTEVKYWMPFVGNAVGLHDAWWQPDFGGSMYRDGYGSHGCVNLPSGKAAELYGIIRVGDVVVTHW